MLALHGCSTRALVQWSIDQQLHIRYLEAQDDLGCSGMRQMITIASRSAAKAGEYAVVGQHVQAQFAGVAIHTRRIRREVGDAEILQGVRIGGMDQFLRKQAWECQEQHPSKAAELDMTLHSWTNFVQTLDYSRVNFFQDWNWSWYYDVMSWCGRIEWVHEFSRVVLELARKASCSHVYTAL